MLATSTGDAAAISLDWAIPLFAVGVLTAGVALVATDTGPGANLTSSDPDAGNAAGAGDEVADDLPGTSEEPAGAEAPDASDATDANTSEPDGSTNTSASGNATAGSPVLAEAWRNRELDVGADWRVEDVVAGPRGEHVYAVGRATTGPSNPTYDNGTALGVVAAIDTDDGTLRWSATTAGPDDEGARLLGVDVDAAGHRLVAAGSTRAGERTFYTVGLNATTGELSWTSTVEHPDVLGGRATDVAVTPDGGHAVATGSNERVAVAFQAATGEHAWTAFADDLGSTAGYTGEAIEAGPRGEHVYVTGRHHPEDPDRSISVGTVAFGVADGEPVWLATEPTDADVGRGHDVAVSPAGDAVAVAGVASSPETNGDQVAVLYDAATGEQRWVDRHDGYGGGTDEARAVGFAPTGRTVYVTGTASVPEAERDLTATAFATGDGSVRWRQTYDGGADDVDRGRALAADPLGQAVFVAGSSSGPPGGSDADAATLAYEPATGELVDEHRFDATRDNASHEQVRGLVLDPTGSRLVLVGSGPSNPLAIGFHLRPHEPRPSAEDETTAFLAERWNNTESAGGLEDLRLVDTVASSDPDLLVAAGSARVTDAAGDREAGDRVGVVTAYDGDGHRRWTTTIAPEGNPSLLHSVDLAADEGRIAVAGGSKGAETDRMLVATLNLSTGQTLWDRTFLPEGTGYAASRDVVLAPGADRVAVTGITYDDRVTVAFEQGTGDTAWVALERAGEDQRLVGRALATGPSDERLFVVGRNALTDGGRGQLATQAYDLHEGQRLWSATWQQTPDSHARASAVSVDPAGDHVAIAGTSVTEDTGGDLATIVYDADTGDQRWARHLDGPASGGDQARDVAFGAEGRTVLVTGETSGDDGTVNATVVAYATEGGERRWIDSYGANVTGADIGLALATDGRDTAYVLARSSGGEDRDQDAVVLAYDVAAGDRLGEARFDLDPRKSTTGAPAAMAIDPGDRYVGIVGGLGEPRDGRPFAVVYELGDRPR